MHRSRRTSLSRARWLVPVLLGVLVAGGLPAATAAPTAAPTAASTAAAGKGKPGPLAVRLTSMAPATIPRSGTLRLHGVVTNTSDGAWQDINVHAFASTEPITTSAGLVRAAALPYDADVGARLQTSNAFVPIGDLPPGKSTDFTLRIPRAELPIPDQPGVYWVGVHALGTNKLGRDTVADGRARTFAPLYRATTPRTDLTMVVPFRAKVRRDSTGALSDPKRWERLLGEQGRLERILGEVESAGSTPVTLVLDPTVLDAADTLAGAQPDPVDGGTPSPSPSATPSDEASDEASDGASEASDGTGTPSSGSSADASSDSDDPVAARARVWLDRLTTVAATKSVLGTGYADPDVAGLGRRSPELLTTSFELARGTFEAYHVDAQAAVVPPGGYLPDSVLPRIDSETRLLLTDRTDHPARTNWRSVAGQQILFGDAGAASGGPGPSAPRTALAIRQRIVSDAALRAMSGSKAPMVVILPAGWDPGRDWRQADLFGALDQPWLRLVGLPAPSTAAPRRRHLTYPARQRRAEIGRGMVRATDRAVVQAQVYADALTEPDGAVDGYTRLALQSTSYHARNNRLGAVRDAERLRQDISDSLRGIRVVGSPFVTMSGKTGNFVVTLVNDLDQRVRVGIRARTNSSLLSIDTPNTVTLPAKQRTTVRLSAASAGIGVREVTLVPITDKGDEVGTPISFSVRSSQVGILIWAIMGVGMALLVVMIIRRWVKRGLSRRSTAP